MSIMTQSRNKREGHYVGWRYAGRHISMDGRCRPVGHERTGNKGLWSLKGWARKMKQEAA